MNMESALTGLAQETHKRPSVTSEASKPHVQVLWLRQCDQHHVNMRLRSALKEFRLASIDIPSQLSVALADVRSKQS